MNIYAWQHVEHDNNLLFRALTGSGVLQRTEQTMSGKAILTFNHLKETLNFLNYQTSFIKDLLSWIPFSSLASYQGCKSWVKIFILMILLICKLQLRKIILLFHQYWNYGYSLRKFFRFGLHITQYHCWVILFLPSLLSFHLWRTEKKISIQNIWIISISPDN